MNLKKVVNPELIPMGLGVFGATFLATQLGDLLEKQANPVVVDYRRELVGAILTVAGSLMMRGSKDMRTVGMAIGATGVAAIASGLTRRFMGDRTSNTSNTDTATRGGTLAQLPPGGPSSGYYVLV